MDDPAASAPLLSEYTRRNPFFSHLANYLALDRGEAPPFPDAPPLPSDGALAQILRTWRLQRIDDELRYAHAQIDRLYAELEAARAEIARLRRIH